MAFSEGFAWLEGRVQPLSEARIPVTDRGFLLADSIFDSVRTYGGRAFLLGDHLDRLRRSAEALAMPVPWKDAELTGIVDSLLAACPGDSEAVLRIVVARGDGGHGLVLPEPQAPRLVVLCRPLSSPPAAAYTDGVAVGLPVNRLTKDPSDKVATGS